MSRGTECWGRDARSRSPPPPRSPSPASDPSPRRAPVGDGRRRRRSRRRAAIESAPHAASRFRRRSPRASSTYRGTRSARWARAPDRVVRPSANAAPRARRAPDSGGGREKKNWRILRRASSAHPSGRGHKPGHRRARSLRHDGVPGDARVRRRFARRGVRPRRDARATGGSRGAAPASSPPGRRRGSLRGSAAPARGPSGTATRGSGGTPRVVRPRRGPRTGRRVDPDRAVEDAGAPPRRSWRARTSPSMRRLGSHGSRTRPPRARRRRRRRRIGAPSLGSSRSNLKGGDKSPRPRRGRTHASDTHSRVETKDGRRRLGRRAYRVREYTPPRNTSRAPATGVRGRVRGARPPRARGARARRRGARTRAEEEEAAAAARPRGGRTRTRPRSAAAAARIITAQAPNPTRLDLGEGFPPRG